MDATIAPGDGHAGDTRAVPPTTHSGHGMPCPYNAVETRNFASPEIGALLAQGIATYNAVETRNFASLPARGNHRVPSPPT